MNGIRALSDRRSGTSIFRVRAPMRGTVILTAPAPENELVIPLILACCNVTL
jgi:hypothetical protein